MTEHCAALDDYELLQAAVLRDQDALKPAPLVQDQLLAAALAQLQVFGGQLPGAMPVAPPLPIPADATTPVVTPGSLCWSTVSLALLIFIGGKWLAIGAATSTPTDPTVLVNELGEPLVNDLGEVVQIG